MATYGTIRRDDVPDSVERIAIKLRHQFGQPAVFMDISSIAIDDKDKLGYRLTAPEIAGTFFY